jgi:parallel beta-helix repeat protein
MATLAEEKAPGPDIWDPCDPEFTPETPRPGEDFTVKATVENKGGVNTAATFKVSLYINGTLHDEETISGLNAGVSKTVTFDPVNLPYGCHNFTLVKDPDYNITDELPANRGDNIHTVFYQVGNVIAVRSNDDFEALKNEGLATKVGDTYYIEDLTITNCAGIGILIKDTTVPFVIENCNVNDCGSMETDGDNHGIHLNHLRAETKEIIGCTVNNNRGKGIQVMNSTYVDITGSHIQNNLAYGIDVYPRGLPGNHDDCKYVNITNNELIENNYGIELIGYNCTVCGNTMRDSDEYGMYMLGKYNQVYNNTIKDNLGYGMKLENCTDNCICWNDFINNQVQNGAQAIDDTGASHWNSTVEIAYKHSGTGTGGSSVNYMGNYWTHFACTDADNDGICDGDCRINDYGGAIITYDYYPLRYLWPTYTLMCGDVTGDGAVAMDDAIAIIRNDISTCDWAADTTGEGAIAMNDAIAIIRNDLNCCGPCG